MPHITVGNDEPGIRGLMAHRPDTAAPLNYLANVLLREPASLSRGERELIAAYVSHLNSIPFCAETHGAAAAAQLDGGRDTVRAVCAGDSAPVTPRLRALLRIAAEARQHARPVSDDAVAAARAEGAEDSDIHDTVLIAAAFCMYNRYVGCPSTDVPTEGATTTQRPTASSDRATAQASTGTTSRTCPSAPQPPRTEAEADTCAAYGSRASRRASGTLVGRVSPLGPRIQATRCRPRATSFSVPSCNRT